MPLSIWRRAPSRAVLTAPLAAFAGALVAGALVAGALVAGAFVADALVAGALVAGALVAGALVAECLGGGCLGGGCRSVISGGEPTCRWPWPRPAPTHFDAVLAGVDFSALAAVALAEPSRWSPWRASRRAWRAFRLPGLLSSLPRTPFQYCGASPSAAVRHRKASAMGDIGVICTDPRRSGGGRRVPL